MVGPNIHCNQVTKHFEAITAVEALSVTFEAGRTTALVGPSGCGKSTVLRLIAGLTEPDEGTVLLGSDAPALVAKRGALAVAFQDPSLLPWRTVRSNIALGAELARKPADHVDKLIELVGLGGFAEHRPAELSGGMRQRAAIARSLISKPEILLLDEPFGAVDAITRRRLNTDLPPLWRERGTTVVLVTHSVEEAVLLSDRVLVLSHRPASIVADIDIAPDMPRDNAFRTSETFRELSARIFEALEPGAVD